MSRTEAESRLSFLLSFFPCLSFSPLSFLDFWDMSVTIIQDSYFLGTTGGIWTDSTMGWYNGTAVYASKANSTTADHDLVHATFQGKRGFQIRS